MTITWGKPYAKMSGRQDRKGEIENYSIIIVYYAKSTANGPTDGGRWRSIKGLRLPCQHVNFINMLTVK